MRRATRSILQFVGEVEAVAGLDLDRRRAIGQQGAGARQRLREQCVLVGGARRAHRRHDAAAGARDVLVAGAVQALLELAGAVAAEDQVGMAVDQPRRDQRPLHRLDLRGQHYPEHRAGRAARRHGGSRRPSSPTRRVRSGHTACRCRPAWPGVQSSSRPSQRVVIQRLPSVGLAVDGSCARIPRAGECPDEACRSVASPSLKTLGSGLRRNDESWVNARSIV